MPEAPTQPIPAYDEQAEATLPLGRLAAVCAVSILAGSLLAAAQDWKIATVGEPEAARILWWIAAGLCLLAGALCLLGLAYFALWGAVAAVNRRSDQRRAVVARQARVARRAECERLRQIGLAAAATEVGAEPEPVYGALRLLGRKATHGHRGATG